MRPLSSRARAASQESVSTDAEAPPEGGKEGKTKGNMTFFNPPVFHLSLVAHGSLKGRSCSGFMCRNWPYLIWVWKCPNLIDQVGHVGAIPDNIYWQFSTTNLWEIVCVFVLVTTC